jgi:hypothetical protein
MLQTRATVVPCAIIASSLLFVMCGDDGGGLSDCQQCISDYCHCKANSDALDVQAQMDCANNGAECVAAKCTTEEAAEIDYDDCSAHLDGDGSDGDSSDLHGGTDGPSVESYDGVDLLIVVDNSGSMAEEQEILSTAVFTLINQLTMPGSEKAVENVRVAVVTTDMGLQYGEDHNSTAVTVNGCADPKGDDGAFMDIPSTFTSISMESGVITCAGTQGCPEGWSCSSGVCNAPGVSTVNCPQLYDDFAEIVDGDSNAGLGTLVACMVQQGTGGCGVEQQLAASVRGLEVNGDDFLVDTHVLAVLIVSDEEDCSIDDPSLFNTNEWLSGPEERLNIACNFPDANNDYLFAPNFIRRQLLAFKGNREEDVFFTAIVGVPLGGAGCQGAGDEIYDCLDHRDMEIELNEFHTADGESYTHFAPACTRNVGSTEVTVARPGVRYVETAQLFGAQGQVYSICNANWSPAMETLADTIRNRLPD